MSLAISVRLGEGFMIDENIFVQIKPDKKGKSTWVKVLIDAPPEMRISRLSNRGAKPKGE